MKKNFSFLMMLILSGIMNAQAAKTSVPENLGMLLTPFGITLPFQSDFSTIGGASENSEGSETLLTEATMPEGFLFSNSQTIYAGGEKLKFGACNEVGILTTDLIITGAEPYIEVKFDAVAWPKFSSALSARVKVVYGSQTAEIIVAAKTGWPVEAEHLATYSCIFSAIVAPTSLSIETTDAADDNEYRIFLDNISIKELSTLPEEPTLLIAWDFTGVGTSATPVFAATTYDNNLDAANTFKDITRGPTATWSTGGNSFRTAGFKNNPISVENTAYFQVIVKPAWANSVSLSSISGVCNGTASYAVVPGVASQFAYSLDGTNFTLIGEASIKSGVSNHTFEFDLSLVHALQNVSGTIYLRYYASGQTSTGGWGLYSSAAGVNGLEIYGTTETITQTYQIVATKEIDGITYPWETVEVEHGDGVIFTFSQEECYVVDKVFVDGIEEIGAELEESYAFENVVQNHTLHVVYKRENYIPEGKGAIINIFSHNKVVTIVNENLVPINQVEIVDMLGHIIWKGQATGARTEIPLNVVTGIYAVRIFTQNNQRITTKIHIN
jgi:hypothetical protein